MAGDGSVEFTRFQSPPGDQFDPSVDTWWTKRGLERGHFDFPPAFVEYHDFAPSYRTWEVALWLVIFVYGLVWLVTMGLAWRLRLRRSPRPACLAEGRHP